jgi:hypothetical protein
MRLFAVLHRRGGVLLGLFMLAHGVVMRGLMVVVGGGVMMGGRLMMMLVRRMLR